MTKNEMRLDFTSMAENVAFARMVISAFVMRIDPMLDELNDVQTAVSEAVSNAILHGYGDTPGMVRMAAKLEDRSLCVEIVDCGVGIKDIDKAREPLFTSRPDMERSGMGFTVMESFMDSLVVESTPGRGTTVRMTKHFAAAPAAQK